MKNSMLVRSCVVVVTLGVLLGVAGCGATSNTKQAVAPVTTVQFGSVGGLTDAGVNVAIAKGYFKDARIKVAMVRMASGTDLSSAIATGNLDVAGLALDAGLFNAVAQGVKLKIVGDKQSIIPPNVSATRLVVLKSLVGPNEAATIRNLRGKTVAVSALPSNVGALLDFLLEKYGMSLADVHVIQESYPAITAALLSGQIAAGIELEPFLTQALDSGSVADVDNLCRFFPRGGGTIVPLVYSQDFINRNHEVAQAFMTAYMKGVRVYNNTFVHNGKGKEAVAQIIAQASGQTLSLVLKSHTFGLNPNQSVSDQFLGEMQNWFVQQGMVTKPIKVSTLVDASFAKQAVKELGTYKPPS